jgi:hypothetical protein
MKIMKFIILILLTIITSSINAQPTFFDDQLLEFRFEECSVSGRRPDGEAMIDIKYLKENIYALEISSFFNCFCEPSNPMLTLSKVGITLSVKSHYTQEGIALCECEQKIIIKIKIPTEVGDIPLKVNNFYFVQDGTVLGHAIIPKRKIQPTKP